MASDCGVSLMREALPMVSVERLATDAQNGKIADPVFQQDFMIVYHSFTQCVRLFQDCHTEIWSTPTHQREVMTRRTLYGTAECPFEGPATVATLTDRGAASACKDRLW